jgi:hypothetical protein
MTASPDPAGERPTRNSTVRGVPSFVRLLLAAFLGALAAALLLGVAGYLWLDHEVDHINDITISSFSKAFEVANGEADTDTGIKTDQQCRDVYQTSQPDETYTDFAKDNC